MLHDLANDGGFVALKRAAKDREGWIQRKDVKNLLYSRALLMMMMALLVDICLFVCLVFNGTFSIYVLYCAIGV